MDPHLTILVMKEEHLMQGR